MTVQAEVVPTVSVIICTRHRPDDLASCLRSLSSSSFPIAEVIVSDDGTEHTSREVVESFGHGARWTRGPKRGLGPNRNHALGLASGSHVLFLDDDAALGSDFLASCVRHLGSCGPAANRTIVTGVELRESGHGIVAHEQDFLGYQRRPYRPGEPIKTVVINSALFPRELFRMVRFDEQLVYGYDEVDLTSRAVSAGYSIMSVSDAANRHHPSPINRDYYRPRQEAARLYVTAKRRLVTERAPIRAGGFLAVAIPHVALSAMKARRQAPVRYARSVTMEAMTMLKRHLLAR